MDKREDFQLNAEYIAQEEGGEERAEVNEMCPSCEREVTIFWDTERDGYKAYCPYCGEWLMLCSACHDDGHECDYDRDTDSCRWNPAMKGE